MMLAHWVPLNLRGIDPLWLPAVERYAEAYALQYAKVKLEEAARLVEKEMFFLSNGEASEYGPEVHINPVLRDCAAEIRELKEPKQHGRL